MNRYEWYKSRGICPRCGQEDAAKGKVYCLNCLDKEAVSTMIWRSKNRTADKNKEYCRMRYYKAKEDGMCVRCFMHKARAGKATCQSCFNKVHEKQAIYHRLRRWGDGQ